MKLWNKSECAESQNWANAEHLLSPVGHGKCPLTADPTSQNNQKFSLSVGASTGSIYVTTQSLSYTLKYFLANISLHIHINQPRIIPAIAWLPLMQCNWPKHTRFASVPGFGCCADFLRIRASPRLSISLWCYFYRLFWLTDISTDSLQAIQQTLAVWYLLPWRIFH